MTIHYHIDDIDQVAVEVLAFAKAKCIIFNAPMGSGKTTFIKAICKQLGVSEAITSPTFSIVNEYQGEDCTIYHFDLYRIKDVNELFSIGIEDYLDSDHYILIEWPELILDMLDEHYLITINVDSPQKRTMTVMAK